MMIPARLQLLFVCCALTSCATIQDLKKQQQQIDALQSRLNAEAEANKRSQIELRKLIDDSTSALTRNSADTGAQMERFAVRVLKVEGNLEETNQSLREVKQQVGSLETKVTQQLKAVPPTLPATTKSDASLPEDPDEAYALASSKLSSSNQKLGRELTRAFITRFPSDKRVATAQLALGDSYFAETKFASAIQEYRKILDNYKKTPEEPEALYKIGLSFYQLKYCADADTALNELVKEHSTHKRVKEAKRTLKLIKTYRKDSRFCLS